MHVIFSRTTVASSFSPLQGLEFQKELKKGNSMVVFVTAGAVAVDDRGGWDNVGSCGC